MKKEYDFSEGTRGKFYKKGAHLRLPIYLSANLQHSLEKLAQKKHLQIGDMVNGLVKKEVKLLQKHF